MLIAPGFSNFLHEESKYEAVNRKWNVLVFRNKMSNIKTCKGSQKGV